MCATPSTNHERITTVPRKSKLDLTEERLFAELERKIYSPDICETAKSKYAGTLASLLKRRAKSVETKAKAAAARRAERKANQPHLSWLPARGEDSDAYHARMARQKAALSAD